MTTVDVSEIRRLEREMRGIPAKTVPAARAILQKGALNIKTDWQRRWTGLAHAPMLPYAISYDTKVTLRGDIEAEIGPDKDKPQGALGNLLEFGSVNNPPHPAGAPALAAEQPKFEQALADLAEKLAGGTL